jgi:hypothetical protein
MKWSSLEVVMMGVTIIGGRGCPLGLVLVGEDQDCLAVLEVLDIDIVEMILPV